MHQGLFFKGCRRHALCPYTVLSWTTELLGFPALLWSLGIRSLPGNLRAAMILLSPWTSLHCSNATVSPWAMPRCHREPLLVSSCLRNSSCCGKALLTSSTEDLAEQPCHWIGGINITSVGFFPSSLKVVSIDQHENNRLWFCVLYLSITADKFLR